MTAYKRNQVEEAISGLLYPREKEPSAELRNRIKRLLDTDRAAARALRSKDLEQSNYAFYSAVAPGRGVDVWFSEYEAFALLTGLNLLGHGWTQQRVVSIMRRIRPELGKEHAYILTLDPETLFDEAEIRRNVRSGSMAFDVTKPVLLMIISKSDGEPHALSVFREVTDAMKFLWEATGGGGAGTIFECTSLAHRLALKLAETTPTPRGRTNSM
jgi:hypothetical protein